MADKEEAKWLHRKRVLETRAKALGLEPGSKRYRAYVYGTLQKMGWRSSRWRM
jgi:hypothetical protein